MRMPRTHAVGAWVWGHVVGFWTRIDRFFRDRCPTFAVALGPMVALSFFLFCRYPTTNYIFDEQEALLGNPYVNQLGFRYEDAIYRDFWGLPANASIGSYRPVPNYLWRGLVEVGERGQHVMDAHVSPDHKAWFETRFLHPEKLKPLQEEARKSWFQHIYNLFFHGVNGALFVAMAWHVTRRRMVAWVAGTTFVTAAILTEAVSGVVGLADVLGGLGALLALYSLGLRAHAMPFGVFLAVLLGLFSKESAIVCIPLIPVAALLVAPLTHPNKPARVARAALAFVGALAAFVLYVELRKRWFPSSVPAEVAKPLDAEASVTSQLARDFMIWFHQPPLPKDPLNNPLVDAEMDHRVAGAMRVYFRGLTQVVFPWTLSGDYSFPQEPVPTKVIFPESVLGWAFTVLPLGGALGIWIVSLLREKREAVPVSSLTLPEDPPEPGFLRRRLPGLVDRFAQTSFGRYLRSHEKALLRALVEALLILVSFLLVKKLLGIGPSELNKDMGDKDPELNIVIPPHLLTDALAYAALGSITMGAWLEAWWKPRDKAYADFRIPLLAVGMVWLVVSYFPHSNMYVLLPTVRAERLWYFPVLGTTMIVTVALVAAHDRLKRSHAWSSYAWFVPFAFLLFQATRSYLHATDYRDDLIFWRETKDAVPHSAKAHLNYSVMAGARGMMQIRLEESHIARNLAPDWAMAHIYTGDTLCRMEPERADEAWPHYARGFRLGPNDKGLISLALQCLWDRKKLKQHEAELRAIAADHPGSWFAHLADDTLRNGDTQGGVQRDARPRGYDQAAKTEETEETAEATADPSSDPSATGGSAEPQVDPSVSQDPAP